MTVVVDYPTLTQAIADWSHNALLTAGPTPYSDGFIQRAQAQIEKDIPAQNFGNYIRFQESGFLFGAITGGIYPVPSDWLGPKKITVADGSGNTFPLQFVNTNWLYNRYPMRTSQGVPAYIARDSFGSATLTGSIAAGLLTVITLGGGSVQPGQYLTDTTGAIGETLAVTGTESGTGGLGTYDVSDATLTVGIESMAANGNVFVFGPAPDGAYTLQGTYYASAPQLSSSTTTNWMVLNASSTLLAACMMQAGAFLKDQAMVQMWSADYGERIGALVQSDKAERWAASTLSIQTA
jgi:hypothetical protein